MKLAHYLKDNQIKVAIVKDNFLFNIDSLPDSVPSSVRAIDELLSRGLLAKLISNQDQILKSTSQKVSVDSAKILSPILNPEKIFLAAVNYISHASEQKVKPPPYPYLFTKFRNCLIGPTDPLIAPRLSKKVDWEAELAVVIGKKGKNIRREDAMNYVAGYTVANDISFRDIQMNEDVLDKPSWLDKNWVKGKGLDSSFPLGPYLVTTDEITDPYSCRITLHVNGKKMQDGLAGEMVFKINELIEYASAGTTLVTGDIISTGTPMGVAAFNKVPFLKDGDIVETEIEGIGTLRNPVIAE